jgi:hypothetical protein
MPQVSCETVYGSINGLAFFSWPLLGLCGALDESEFVKAMGTTTAYKIKLLAANTGDE